MEPRVNLSLLQHEEEDVLNEKVQRDMLQNTCKQLAIEKEVEVAEDDDENSAMALAIFEQLKDGDSGLLRAKELIPFARATGFDGEDEEFEAE